MSATSSTIALAPIVKRVGGALAIVMANPSAYVDTVPGKKVQVAIARIIETRPTLNTEESIGQILDLVMFHGISGAETLARLIDGLNLERIHLAANFLYEEGERGGALHKGSSKHTYRTIKHHAGLKSVEKVADLIASLSSLADRTITDTDDLAVLIERLGGLDAVLDMGSVTLALEFGYTEYDLTSLEEAQEANERAAAIGEYEEE